MGKYLIFSDLHENLALFQKMLQMPEVKECDQLYFLGDAACRQHEHDGKHDPLALRDSLEILRNRSIPCLRGNWEAWLLSPDEDEVNHQKHWSKILKEIRENLDEQWVEFIKNWETTIQIDKKITLTHGCPYAPHNGENTYIARPEETYLYPYETRIIKDAFDEHVYTSYMIFGHTHRPGYFTYNGETIPYWHELKADMIDREISFEMDLEHDLQMHYAINPGSLEEVKGSTQFRTMLWVDTEQAYFKFIRVNG